MSSSSHLVYNWRGYFQGCGLISLRVATPLGKSENRFSEGYRVWPRASSCAKVKFKEGMATAPYSVLHRQEVDKNGEVIIAEALCNRTKLYLEICCIYYAIAILTFLICLPCALIVGCCLGRKAAAEWRLYLTSTGLHYSKVSLFGCRQEIFIPLSDIKDVSVQETIRTRNGMVTSQGHTLMVWINRDKAAEYIPWCQRTLCFMDYLSFSFIENASDFRAAVKRQLCSAMDN